MYACYLINKEYDLMRFFWHSSHCIIRIRILVRFTLGLLSDNSYVYWSIRIIYITVKCVVKVLGCFFFCKCYRATIFYTKCIILVVWVGFMGRFCYEVVLNKFIYVLICFDYLSFYANHVCLLCRCYFYWWSFQGIVQGCQTLIQLRFLFTLFQSFYHVLA